MGLIAYVTDFFARLGRWLEEQGRIDRAMTEEERDEMRW